MLDQLDKDVNKFSMRIRCVGDAVACFAVATGQNSHRFPFLSPHSEWYSYHFPELVKIVNDNYLFARLVMIIKRRTSLTDERCALCMGGFFFRAFAARFPGCAVMTTSCTTLKSDYDPRWHAISSC